MRAGRKQHILSDLFILEISEDICEKTASPRRGNFSDLNSSCLKVETDTCTKEN